MEIISESKRMQLDVTLSDIDPAIPPGWEIVDVHIAYGDDGDNSLHVTVEYEELEYV